MVPGDDHTAFISCPELIQRVRAEYLEMPGLRLTAPQVQRLCGIDRATCDQVLDALVSANFLCIKPDRHYARSTEGRES